MQPWKIYVHNRTIKQKFRLIRYDETISIEEEEREMGEIALLKLYKLQLCLDVESFFLSHSQCRLDWLKEKITWCFVTKHHFSLISAIFTSIAASELIQCWNCGISLASNCNTSINTLWLGKSLLIFPILVPLFLNSLFQWFLCLCCCVFAVQGIAHALANCLFASFAATI